MGEEWSFLRPDFVGRLTPLTFREGDLRVPSENREFSAAEGTSWASICRSAALGCGGSIPSLPTDFFRLAWAKRLSTVTGLSCFRKKSRHVLLTRYAFLQRV
jgi:hypothetical protein